MSSGFCFSAPAHERIIHTGLGLSIQQHLLLLLMESAMLVLVDASIGW